MSDLRDATRAIGTLGDRATIDAKVKLYFQVDEKTGGAKATRLNAFADELRFFFITSDVGLEDVFSAKETLPSSSLDGQPVWIDAQVADAPKCIRCWHHRPDVGVNPDHPEICGRCVSNLPDGPGEQRHYF